MSTVEDVATTQSSRDIADWNTIAENYTGNFNKSIHNPMYLQLKEVLWDSLGNLNGLNVLDLGCGDGWLSRLLHEAGATVLGIDGSERLLEYARSNHSDI